ncbi:hypothetical protein [Methylobacter sp. YRD-M1]|jgi:hypothetical protein|uniref:hypothetical protein n=1 Tax=Methylobacter sp. YRD-M1 TaxID=2911520 RepID=UPI00227A4400|nr:hypothetical protein [Methylobacter sp. YRD-M1]WAK04403.1 hypothetical protein LZ558_22320 [Methylobacter sp. YRD-M1]
MCKFKILLLLSCLFCWGLAQAESTIIVSDAQSGQKPAVSLTQPVRASNAQTQLEQAADDFDAFALLMPKVAKAKLEAFMAHGLKAILLPDTTTQNDEEQMIDYLVKGLQALGHSLEEDLAAKNPPKQDASPQSE